MTIDITEKIARAAAQAASGCVARRFAEAACAAVAAAAPHQSRAEAIFDGFFAGRVHSFRESYVTMTGDKRVTGKLEDCDPQRVRHFLESIDTAGFGTALGASVNRAAVEAYRQEHTDWPKLVRIVPLNEFRQQRYVRWGGYPNLPIVNQGAAYTPLASPADQVSTFSPAKRGGTEDITLEAIRNDDVGLLREIPKRLATAAQRTLRDFALDFLRLNPVIADGLTLFHANHGNLGSAALSAVGLMAGANAMRKQAEPGSGARLGLKPRYLWVPIELEETAVNLFRQGANQERTFVENLTIDVVRVIDWSDTNDWCLSCDPAQNATIALGFLDGKEEPEIFVQDAPTAGSLFTHDKLTWKIRHVYGGTPVDHRGVFKSVVA